MPAAGVVEVAGMSLPEHIGPWTVALVQYGGDPTQGAFVRYLPNDTTSALPRIDVIVYPAATSLTEEVALTHGDLLETDRTSARIDDTTLLSEGILPLVAIGDTAYRAIYYIAVQDVAERSIVWLHDTGDRFVKARTSFALHVGYDPVDSVDAAITRLLESARSTR